MLIDHATPADIRAVALKMRESDFLEFSALTYHETRVDLAEHLVARFAGQGCIRASTKDGVPVAIGDVVELRPNVVSLLFFATDRFPEIATPLTRFIVQRLFPKVREAGVHRIEAITAGGHASAHRWLRTLGLKPEAGLRKFGRAGEDYVYYAWVAPDVH